MQQRRSHAVHYSNNGKRLVDKDGYSPVLEADAYRLDVRDYGAKGDGVTNDTSAIVAAVADAYSATKFAGGTPGRKAIVYFPEGIFIVNNVTISGYVRWVGAGRNQTVIKASSTGDSTYLVASATYLQDSYAFCDAPFEIDGITFDGAGVKTNTFVCRAFYPVFRSCGFAGANGGANLLLSASGRDGTALSSTMVNGSIHSCWFGSAANPSALSAVDLDTIDPGAKITDWIVSKCFFTGGAVCTHNLRLIKVSAGWMISNNHFYGATLSLYIMGAIFGTSITSNIVEGNVEMYTIAGATAGATFGPGNVVYDGSFTAGFGLGGGAGIVSVGNSYMSGYILHNYFDGSKVLVSQNDYFSNATPLRWHHGASTGVITVINGFNALTNVVMNGSSNAVQSQTGNDFTVTTYNVLNTHAPFVARAKISAANAFTLTAVVPVLPTDTLPYKVSFTQCARTNHTGTVRLNYAMDGIIVRNSGGTYAMTIGSETLTGAQFTVQNAWSLIASGSQLTITITATFADVLSQTAYGGAVLTVM